ncbi:MAG TPA: oxalate/formate MFS antiporter [Kofleriaceae bacterium]|nr:oxalate/formate MFS antiporter [Kofleriaceae bacterium]
MAIDRSSLVHHRIPAAERWIQLILGIICMAMIANLQYGWTLFVNPIHEKFQWQKSDIQVAFTIFVLMETWLVPVEGYLVDRFGPALVTVCGGVLVALAWTLNSFADSLTLFYIAATVGGIGAGAVYGTCVGNALKWFPDRRGLAAGLTAMGFGAGSALTIVPISSFIRSHGFQDAFLYFGLGQGAIVFLLGWLLHQPDAARLASLPRGALPASARSYEPMRMVRAPVFWVMYLMFVLMAAGGLMATAQLAPIARDFEVADVDVSILGLTLPALTFALSIDRILNGLTRPVFGWVSDRVGRENTMFAAFLLEAIGIVLLSQFGGSAVSFVVLSGLVFFAWGEIYSLFPSTCTDTFGPRFATANAGLLYTAKGTAALLVPLSSILARSGWKPVFLTAAGMNLVAALMALLILKPMRRRWAARAGDVPAAPTVAAAATLPQAE